MRHHPWSFLDIVGKYHKTRLKAEYPVAGTAISRDVEREARRVEVAGELEKSLKRIQSARERKVRQRTVRANCEWAAEAERRVHGSCREIEQVLHHMQSEHLQGTDREIKVEDDDGSRWSSAVSEMNLDAMESMLRTGYAWTDSALLLAVRAGNVDAVQLLVEYGADPEARNELGDTALLQAWIFWDDENGQSLGRDENESRTVRILQILLEHGARIHALRSDGSTALHEAARKGPTRAVKLLLSYGADHELCDMHGNSPVRIANERSNEESARLLSSWSGIREEIRLNEFFQEWWNSMPTKPGQRRLSLDQGPSAQRVLEDVQLDLAHRRLDQSLRTRNQETPFATYDQVRRDVCCREDERRSLEESWCAASSPQNVLVPAQPIASIDKPSVVPREVRTKKRASETKPLSVPLDKYLLHEVKPSFVETHKVHVRRSERENVLAKIEEKEALKRREKREHYRSATTNVGRKANIDTLRRRREAAARAVLSDGLNKTCARSALNSSLLHQTKKKKPASSIAPINKINVVLADLERMTSETRAADCDNSTASLRPQQHGLERGKQNRLVAARRKKFNDIEHLPCDCVASTKPQSERDLTSVAARIHRSFPWEYHPPGQYGCPSMDYLTTKKPRKIAEFESLKQFVSALSLEN